ncbi:MAG: hypothetical protein ABL888_08070 [Pirellulaceae bacterium]
MKSETKVWFKRLLQRPKHHRSIAIGPVKRKPIWTLGFESLEARRLLSATKWSSADFELINAENPEGHPWISATPDGRFSLTFFESFAGPPAYTDLEERVYNAAGASPASVGTTFSAGTVEKQPASAYMADGRRVIVWTETPTAGGGNLEDVYASVYYGNNVVDLPRFLVSGGASAQLDPEVAASDDGFVVAMNDGSVAGGRLILKFYNIAGTLINTVNAPDAPEGVNQTGLGEHRDVEITALANGNYVVTWADHLQFDIFARIFSPGGIALSGILDVEPGGANATFPDVTALADGGFVATYGQYTVNDVRGRIYEANGTPSGSPFDIATNAMNALQQQAQTAALQDGRFVTVWLTTAGNIAGRVMSADGTPDGAAFAVNGDAAGDKGRPTIATLADGRFVVSWESGVGAAKTIFSTIFDARNAGLNGSASSFNDDWYGTNFADTVYAGTGADVIRGAGGADRLFGESGDDTLNGEAGNDRLYGGNNTDTLNGGANNDILFGQPGDDLLNGDAGNDALHGDAGDDSLWGGDGVDSLWGGVGADVFRYLSVGESGLMALRDKIIDFNQSQFDLIDVINIDGKTSDPASSTFSFIGNAAFTAEGQIRAFQVGSTAVVEFNTTGNGAAEMQIALVNFTAANLTINDFVVPPLLMGFFGATNGSVARPSLGTESERVLVELGKSQSRPPTNSVQLHQANAYALETSVRAIVAVDNTNRSTNSKTQTDLEVLDSVFEFNGLEF